MITFGGKIRIDQIDKKAKNNRGYECVKVLIVDPNNKDPWYTGEKIEFYGDDNKEFFSDKKVGDIIGIQVKTWQYNGFWRVQYTAYSIKE